MVKLLPMVFIMHLRQAFNARLYGISEDVVPTWATILIVFIKS